MRFNSLDEWLTWQETLHPSEIDLGLDRIATVFQKLYPDPELPVVITVAGTNGKGSSVAMLDAIYRAAGYKVGKYTSPHLFNYNERICIDGNDVADDVICQSFERIEQAREGTSLTYFEFGTLAALDIFLLHKLDLVILEVGLGGRLDAVNIIDADVALITAISQDHTQWLGDDVSVIAREKAGIMRNNKPVVSSGRNQAESLQYVASETGARLYQIDVDFSASIKDNSTWSWQFQEQMRSALPLPALYGVRQLDNAAGVLMVIELLAQQLPVNQQAIRQGLMSVKLAGRFQLLPGQPVCIFDVAHNADAIKHLARQLTDFHCQGRILAVLGMLSDKASRNALGDIQNQVDEWFIAPLPTPRSETTENLGRILMSLNDKTVMHNYVTIKEAFDGAQQVARDNDCILVFGSFYTVAEAMQQTL